MDMRFGTIRQALACAADPGPIDYQCFVAALAAAQAASATARAAVAAQEPAPRPVQVSGLSQALDRAADGSGEHRPAGAFHAVSGLQPSETELKDAFTVAFQPSFKPDAYTQGIGERPDGAPALRSE